MNPKKYLIINADDFGMSPGINRGIIEGFEKGVITSASLIVNMPGSDEALEWSRRAPAGFTGLHVNITDGKPVLGTHKTLVNAAGCFHSFGKLFLLGLAGQIDSEEVFKECSAQLEIMESSGVALAHINDHKWWRIIPGLMEPFLEFMKSHPELPTRKVSGLTLAEFKTVSIPQIFHRSTAVDLILRSLSRPETKALLAGGISVPDHYIGPSLTGRSDFRLRIIEMIYKLESGVTELMVHPGQIDPDGFFQSPYREGRLIELEGMLCVDFSEALQKEGIELVNFNHLKETRSREV